MSSTGIGGTVARMGVGCLALLAVWAGASFALDRWVAERVVTEARPWLGVAAGLFFTLSLATIWGMLVGPARGENTREAILARAASGQMPDHDGVVVATGTVRAASVPLRSPITGTPCVAYFYRMFEEVRDTEAFGNHREVPHYWGYASRAFLVDTPVNAVRVQAVPMLKDAARRHGDPVHVAHAQQWVESTRFEVTAPGTGRLGSALSIVSAMLTEDDGESRRDWKLSDTTRTPDTLLLEETTVPVDATVSVAGPWSAARRAIITGANTSSAADGLSGVSVTTGPIEKVLEGQSAVPPSRTYTIVFAIVMAGLGYGVLWGGLQGFAP